MFIICKQVNGVHEEIKADYGSNHVDAIKCYIDDMNGSLDGVFAVYELEPMTDEEGDVFDSKGDVVYKHQRILCWHINGIDLYLNAYMVTQAYGGPEEGGWWYDCGEVIASEPVRFTGPCTMHYREFFKEKCDILLKELEDDHGPHRNRTSAVGDGFDLYVQVSREPGANYPDEKPYYC